VPAYWVCNCRCVANDQLSINLFQHGRLYHELAGVDELRQLFLLLQRYIQVDCFTQSKLVQTVQPLVASSGISR
jgi:hypothetical protein